MQGYVNIISQTITKKNIAKKRRYFKDDILTFGYIDRRQFLTLVKNPLTKFVMPFDNLEHYAIEIPVLKRAINLLKATLLNLEFETSDEFQPRLYVLKEINKGDGAPFLLMSQNTDEFGIFICPSLPSAPMEEDE